jgi:hypothetical protein
MIDVERVKNSILVRLWLLFAVIRALQAELGRNPTGRPSPTAS